MNDIGEIEPTLPIKGLRVLNVSSTLAARLVAMLLADQGADVIELSPSDEVRTTDLEWCSRILNRGKRHISRPSEPFGQSQDVMHLASEADVLIDDGPHGPAYLGKKYRMEQIRLSLPGYSADDAALRHLPADDGIVHALLGAFTDLSVNRALRGLSPAYTPVPIASTYAALYGVVAVATALFRRQRTGSGAELEVPVAAAMTEAMTYSSLDIGAYPDRYLDSREKTLARYQERSLTPELTSFEIKALQDALYRTYTASDGRPFYFVSMSHRAHPVRALKILGLWDDVVSAGFPMGDPLSDQREWAPAEDCSLFSYPLSRGWSDWLAERIAAAISTEPAAHWERAFGEGEAVGCAVRSLTEWMNDAHALAAGLSWQEPTTGDLLPGCFSWMDGDRGTPARLYGNSGKSAKSSGWAASEWSPPKKHGFDSPSPSGALAGLKVVDLTNVIAGPTIGSTLARFGAEVTHITKPVPGHDTLYGIFCGLKVHQGKRNCLLDITSPDGRAILDELLSQADVLTMNSTSKQLERLGLEPSEIRQRFPNLVVAIVTGFTGTHPGPMDDYIGYDDLTQALTGVMERFGGSLQDAEEHAQIGSIDMGCGLLATFQTLLALVERERRGVCHVARSSLAAMGTLLQLPFLPVSGGTQVRDPARGPLVRGEGLGRSCYKAKDGWLLLVAETPSALCRLLDLPARSDLDFPTASAAIAQRPLRHWIARANEIGPEVTLVALEGAADVRDRFVRPNWPADRAWLKDATIGFVREQDHPCGSTVTMAAPCAIRSDGLGERRLTPAEKYGASTRHILAALGVHQEDIERLEKDGVVSFSASKRYFPV